MDNNNNREKGLGHEVKGAVRETVGKVTDNHSQQIKGNVEKNAGKVQNAFGRATDESEDDAKR